MQKRKEGEPVISKKEREGELREIREQFFFRKKKKRDNCFPPTGEEGRKGEEERKRSIKGKNRPAAHVWKARLFSRLPKKRKREEKRLNNEGEQKRSRQDAADFPMEGKREGLLNFLRKEKKEKGKDIRDITLEKHMNAKETASSKENRALPLTPYIEWKDRERDRSSKKRRGRPGPTPAFA